MLARLLVLISVLAAMPVANAESGKEARPRFKSESSDQARTRLWAESFKGEYFRCLGKEMVQAVRRQLSEDEFALIIGNFCLEEVQQLRLAYKAYFSMRFPRMKQIENENETIKTLTDFFVKYYKDRRIDIENILHLDK
jgi:hypothetical protein